MKNIQTFKNFINQSPDEESIQESRSIVTVQDADKFINEFLKLGSRNNLFDKFLKNEGISPNELSTLVSMVATRIKEKWS